jgi:ribosomal 30S subunit maturation factor RimM
MTDEDKILLVNRIIELVRDTQTSEDMPIMVGTLNKAQGINGFVVAEIGHPVFEFKQRYLIYLQSIDGKTTVTVPYYKETLSPVIEFTK